ncbi:hypothetical protein CHH60_28180 [Paenibacillus sp. 7523-1]|nr:hypothetical protein CHH60_28180 [Paenibacillus sp. 7523-1]
MRKTRSSLYLQPTEDRNTIVLKSSPFVPQAAAKVGEINASEFPVGVINVVHGDADVGIDIVQRLYM